MRILLDSHAVLWFTAGDARLGAKLRELIADPGVTKLVSIASWWEIAIKSSLGKLELGLPYRDFVNELLAEGMQTLPLELEHLSKQHSLPFHHQDPFDRAIISQALVEKLPIGSADAVFPAYGVQVVW